MRHARLGLLVTLAHLFGCGDRDAAPPATPSLDETSSVIAGLLAGDDVLWEVRPRLQVGPGGETLVITIRTGAGTAIEGALVEAGPGEPNALAETEPGRYERRLSPAQQVAPTIEVHAFRGGDHYVGTLALPRETQP